MTTAITTRYTRRIRIDAHFYELEPGDQVDIAQDLGEQWATIARVGTHADDRDVEDAPVEWYCEDGCAAVLFFTDDDYAHPWHIQDSDEIYARFPVAAE